MFGSVTTGSQVTRLPSPTSGCLQTETINSTDIFETHLAMYTTSSFANITVSGSFIDETNEGFLKWLYSVSFILYPLIGTIVTMAVGMILSLLTGYTKIENIGPELVAIYVYCGSKEGKTMYEPVEVKEKIGYEDGK